MHVHCFCLRRSAAARALSLGVSPVPRSDLPSPTAPPSLLPPTPSLLSAAILAAARRPVAEAGCLRFPPRRRPSPLKAMTEVVEE
mmetsp:Transcript_18249/g.32419  ORF Transcript_18249/g.32419 Transcript_18249/m.32419 type:complete len:85 (-) Transcript_18249:375-629(-)